MTEQLQRLQEAGWIAQSRETFSGLTEKAAGSASDLVHRFFIRTDRQNWIGDCFLVKPNNKNTMFLKNPEKLTRFSKMGL